MKKLYFLLVAIFIAGILHAQDLIPFGAGGLYGYKTKQGKIVIRPAFDYAYEFSDGIARVKKGEKYGYIDQQGKWIAAAEFDNGADFFDGMAAVNKGAKEDEFGFGTKGGKYGFIDKKGKLVIPLLYDYVIRFESGLAAVAKGNKYGFIDKTGKLVIPIKYDAADGFNEGYAAVNMGAKYSEFGYAGGKWGFIDKTGKEITAIKYHQVESFTGGLASVANTVGTGTNLKFGFIDNTGKEVIALEYDDAHSFSEGLAAVNKGAKGSGILGQSGGKWGFINQQGKKVVDFKYDIPGRFSNGLVRMEIGEQFASTRSYVLLDATGREIVSADKYKYISNKTTAALDKEIGLYDGLIHVQSDKKHGFINKDGKEIIPPKYDYAYSYENGLALVQLNSKYGYINTAGKEVVPVKYPWFTGRDEGFLFYGVNGKYGLLSMDGKEITAAVYDSIFYSQEGMFPVKQNSKFGFVSMGGSIIPPAYEAVWEFISGKAKVKLDGKVFFIDKKGAVVGGGAVQPVATITEKGNGAAAVLPIKAFQDPATKKVGYKDAKENIVIPAQFIMVRDFKDGFASVKMETGSGFINERGEQIVPCVYENVAFFSEERALVQKKIDGKSFIGYVDTKGKEVIPFKYNLGSPFSEGLASVFIGTRNEYIDKDGKVIIRLPEGHKGVLFKGGKAQVNDGKGGFYVIDKKGNKVG